MLVSAYCHQEEEQITITRAGASRFAKEIAGDFNPIHDEDAKRFCVPGDMLFALTITKQGLSSNMRFKFDGMVGGDTTLVIPEGTQPQQEIADANGKTYLSVTADGEVGYNRELNDAFIKAYVSFSGRNFNEVIVPLMKEHNVMVNLARPLVIYESMEFALTTQSFCAPTLVLSDANMNINGKRGDLTLHFDIKCGDAVIGTGKKTMLLSGLQPYCHNSVTEFVEKYNQRIQNYAA